jgi:hypothetical protein
MSQPQPNYGTDSVWDREVDGLIVGSGAAGMFKFFTTNN